MASAVLESARLRLRAWDLAADLAPFSAICADAEVTRHLDDGQPWTKGQSREWMEMNVEAMDRHGFCLWAVEARDSGELLGFCGFRAWEDPGEADLLTPLFALEKLPGSEAGWRVEVGWRLSRASWGHGYATEAAQLALGDGFGRCGFQR